MPHLIAAKAAAVLLAGMATGGYLLASHGSAGGTAGAGIQGSPVRPPGAVQTGHAYPLAAWVTNPGSGTETMTFTLERLTHRGRKLPPSWIHGLGQHITLQPQGDAQAHFTVTIPAGVSPGTYRSDLIVTGSPGTVPGKVNLGAAAATGVIVTITR